MNAEEKIENRLKELLEEFEKTEKEMKEKFNENIKIEFDEEGMEPIKTRGLIASTIGEKGVKSLIYGNMHPVEIIEGLACNIRAVIRTMDEKNCPIPREIVALMVIEEMDKIIHEKG